jgi:ATP-dependent DNA helicase RecG
VNDAERIAKLEELLALPNELEWLEFKTASNEFDFDKLGEYFSALSNETNLHAKEAGWLILGIDNKHNIVGTNWKRNPGALEKLKHDIAMHTALKHTFRHVHQVQHPRGRVLMFEIPPAPHGLPMSWRGHWYGRDGESIGALNQTKLDLIRGQGVPDWSAAVVEGATLSALDANAVATARLKFKEQHPNRAAEVDTWDETTFLNKAKIIRDGKITRAALLLLGKSEAAHLLSPADVRMTWLLKGNDGNDADYQHFGPPFLLNTEALFSRVRNNTYRLMPSGSLFPTTLLTYDTWVVRELLHNCIAHQDYTVGARINVVERDDALIFENLGGFIPQSVGRVLKDDFMPSRYRNPFLVTAMVEVKMIETLGSGIRRVFRTQRERGFPLPDYDLSEVGKVRVTVLGKLIDENYTRALLNEPDLTLEDVLALDKVQKRKPLTDHEVNTLRAKHLVEGRRPNLLVSARVAKATGQEIDHILKAGVGDSHYKQLVVELIRKFGPANPSQLQKLLIPKLPDVLTARQKKDKVKNLIQEMAKKDGFIKNVGKRGAGARWDLAN